MRIGDLIDLDLTKCTLLVKLTEHSERPLRAGNRPGHVMVPLESYVEFEIQVPSEELITRLLESGAEVRATRSLAAGLPILPPLGEKL